jgi:uncharacterized protein YkwD
VERGGRTPFALATLAVALFAFPASASSSDLVGVSAVTTLSGKEQSLLAAINQARAAHGAQPLSLGVRLQRAAKAHSRAMARSGAFGHGNWYRRLRSHGVRGRTLGETIAWGVGTDASARAIVAMWLASPSHRATMLRPGFRRIGVGIAVGSMAGFAGARVATADFSGG